MPAICGRAAAVTADTARIALRGFKRNNFDLDPDNEEHVKAYQEMRNTKKRVTAPILMKYLESRMSTLDVSERVTENFWAVPKQNFQKGLPQRIADARIDVSGWIKLQVDKEAYYIIDQCIPRDLLGKGVSTVSRFMTANTQGILEGGEPNTAIAPSTGGASSGGASSSPQAPTDGQSPESAAGEAILRFAPRDGSPESGESAEVRKVRTQMKTLKMLRGNILQAKADGVWAQGPSTCRLKAHSVFFWVSQTVQALEELEKDKPRDKVVKTIAIKFTSFLIDLAMNSSCYPDWCAFTGIFPKLLKLTGDEDDAAKLLDECKLLEELANTPPEGDRLPNVSGVSVFVVSAFYVSAVYLSFVNARVCCTLKAAQGADNETRIILLEPLRGIKGLPDNVSDSIECALKLFDDKITLPDRAVFMWKQTMAKRMAQHWDPTGVIGMIGKIIEEIFNPDANMSCSTFKRAAKAVAAADIVYELTNPLLKAAVLFVHTLSGPDGTLDPACLEAEAIVDDALAFRLGMKRAERAPDPSQLQGSKAADVFKATKDFLSNLPKNSAPQWYIDWKAEKGAADAAAKEKKEAAAAATAAAAAAKTAAAAILALPAPGPESATGGDAATGVAAADAATSVAAAADGDAATDVAAAAGGGAATGGDAAAGVGAATPPFAIGSRVSCTIGPKGPKGKQQRVTGVVEQDLAKHCWVTIDRGDWPESGNRKKFPHDRIKLIEAEPAAEASNQAAVDARALKPRMSEEDDAKRAIAQRKSEEDGWQACGEVFDH